MTENVIRFIAFLDLYAARYSGMISDDHYITELIKLYNSNEKALESNADVYLDENIKGA